MLSSKNSIDNSRQLRSAQEKAGIPERYLNSTFDNYRPALEDRRSLELLKNYPQQQKRGDIFLFGDHGGGKTHLAASLATFYLSQECPVFFCKVYDLINAYKFQRFGEINEFDRRCKQTSFLIMDDLGAQHDSEYTSSLLFPIVDYRYDRFLKTIYTLNLTPKELAERAERSHQWARMMRRIKDMCSTENGGLILNIRGESKR